MIIDKAPLYKHKKTGNLYQKLADAINKTDDTDCIIYSPVDEPNKVYVRTLDDWNAKFNVCEVLNFNDK